MMNLSSGESVKQPLLEENDKDKKRKKNNKKKKDHDIDLNQLEVIVVESDEEEDVNPLSKSGLIAARTLTKASPYFDFIPDEIMVRICYYLSEQEMGRLGIASKRFAEFLNEESIWQEKAKYWTFSTADKLGRGSNIVKNYYVEKFKANKERKRNHEIVQENERIRLKAEARENTFRTIVSILWMNFLSMELFCSVAVTLWTILLALRADEIILWNYHLVYTPLYVGFIHFWFGLVVGDICDSADIDIKTKYSIICVIAKECSSRSNAKYTIYLIWTCLLTFFVLCAQIQEMDGLMNSIYPVIPVGILFIGSSIVFFNWAKCCASDSGLYALIVLIFMPLIWIILQAWARVELFVLWNWYTAFAPIWIALIGIFIFYLTIGGILISDGLSQSERPLVYSIFLVLLVIQTMYFVWLGQFCDNLDKLERNEPSRSWVFNTIPLFVGEAVMVVALLVGGIVAAKKEDWNFI